MKKIAFYLLVVMVLFSCKGEDGLDGVGAALMTRNVVVDADEWLLSGEPFELGSYYYATVKVPELTYDVLNRGLKLAYIKPATDVQVGLPYVLHKGSDIDGKEYLWTQTYDCEYEVGYVTFILTYSDFDTWQAPDRESFSLVFSYGYDN